jgi:hypothetical protein
MKRKITYVEWEDPTSTDAWTDIAETYMLECYVAKTCGFIITEDDRAICIALSLVEPNDSCSNFIVIPKTHIRHREDMEVTSSVSFVGMLSSR